MSYQLFDPLDPATEAALRESIDRFGVLVPVVRDQHGNTIDGHHRSRIADELGRKYRVDVISVESEDEAEELARTLNTDRRHLTAEQLDAHIIVLREAGASEHAIADSAGVSRSTVHRRRQQLVQENKLTEPERVQSLDGKSRPAKRKPTIVAAKDEKEADRAQAALQSGAAMPGKTLDVKRAERIAREHEADERRATASTEPVTVGVCDLRVCSVSELDIDPESIDAIITDPPYIADQWDVYDDLAIFARKALKPNGVLAVMTGTRLDMVDHVEECVAAYMDRRHRGVYIVQGPRWRDQQSRIGVGYKPILIFQRPDADDLPWVLNDVWESGGDDKDHHEWGQSETGMAALVRELSEPGQLVCDPFLGGGTTAVVCAALGRKFIGCDIDPLCVQTATERLT